MIAGVTGFFAAGKDTVAEMLEARGFRHVSLSDMIRAELRRRGEAIAIPRLTEVGNELRTRSGPGVLGEMALEALEGAENAVVTSIRHGAEVAALRGRPDFVMCFVDAPVRLRYDRSRGRARDGDPVSLEEFETAERAQMQSADPNAQQLAVCRELADFVIENDGSRAELEVKVERMLEEAAARIASR